MRHKGYRSLLPLPPAKDMVNRSGTDRKVQVESLVKAVDCYLKHLFSRVDGENRDLAMFFWEPIQSKLPPLMEVEEEEEAESTTTGSSSSSTSSGCVPVMACA